MVAGHVRQVVVLYSMTVWVFALADSAFVILDEWSSYGGGRLGRFDCIFIG